MTPKPFVFARGATNAALHLIPSSELEEFTSRSKPRFAIWFPRGAVVSGFGCDGVESRRLELWR
jgi:hypothetical protein